jgi:hypothetical protein
LGRLSIITKCYVVGPQFNAVKYSVLTDFRRFKIERFKNDPR